jgi:glucosamine--fructose-6-phosphate aminotransferase (isomerizing)
VTAAALDRPTAMAQEIAEQPEALARTLDALLPLRPELARLAAGRRHVLLVARGSSDNAAVYGRYLLETHAGRRAALAAPSVATHYGARLDLSDTLAVSVSQSGETAEIVQTQAWAASCGARTVAIANTPGSTLLEQADLAMLTAAGRERAVPATKSYTAQCAALAVLASALAGPDDGLDAALREVPGEAAAVLARTDAEGAADLLAGAPQVTATGRGLTCGTALEVALKLEETCLRPVRGLSYADLRHGPIAAVEPGAVAVVVAPEDGPVLPGLADLCSALAAAGVQVLALGGGDALAPAAALALPGPRLPEAVAPLALVLPAQLAVEVTARRLGLDPDAPRGLAKLTVTDPARA